MNTVVLNRILWPYGLLRVLFSALAVFSAASLYLAFPRFASSPLSFVIAAITLFVIEVSLFEFGVRRHSRRAASVLSPNYRQEFGELRNQVVAFIRSNEEAQTLSRQMMTQVLVQQASNISIAQQLNGTTQILSELTVSLQQALRSYQTEIETNRRESNPQRLQALTQTFQDSTNGLREELSALHNEVKELSFSIRRLGENLDEVNAVDEIVSEFQQAENRLKTTEAAVQLATVNFRIKEIGRSLELFTSEQWRVFSVHLGERLAGLGISRARVREFVQDIRSNLTPKQSEAVSLSAERRQPFHETSREPFGGKKM